MKVLILSNFGMGLYKFRKELIKELLLQKNVVYISVPNDKEYVPKLIKMGCKFIETKVDRRGINPINDIKLFMQYIRIIKKIRPEVVLTYTIKPNIYGGLACRMFKVPYINNITGLGSGFNKGKILTNFLLFLYKIGLKNSACVFFQNKEDLNFFVRKKVINSEFKLLPGSGVNLKEFKLLNYPSPDQPITFLFIGRIMKDKGIEEYLEAAKIIRIKYSNTQFLIIGNIEETDLHYKTIIKDYVKKGYVDYLGYKSDVRPYIKVSHCLIQPSHGGEGLSNVLLEAGASGKVLIASNIPGCKETIEEGKNGYIFEPKKIESLVEKIEEFIILPYDVKKDMGYYSRRKIKRDFDRNIVINTYLDKINQIYKNTNK